MTVGVYYCDGIVNLDDAAALDAGTTVLRSGSPGVIPTSDCMNCSRWSAPRHVNGGGGILTHEFRRSPRIEAVAPRGAVAHRRVMNAGVDAARRRGRIVAAHIVLGAVLGAGFGQKARAR